MFKLLIIILILISVIVLFFIFWSPLGGNISRSDRQDYSSRAENYVDGKFQNEGKFSIMSENQIENKFTSRKKSTPKNKIKSETPTFINNPNIDDLTITWLGHSTIILQIHGMNILIDPMFSEYSSPVQFIGPKRFSSLSVEIEQLPNIDVVVITHDHYDHLDYNTIKRIDNKVNKYVVPLGVENHLERWGINENKITNMAWWEEVNINGLTIGCTPAQHYSGRKMIDNYNTLWASFVFKDEYYKVYESGDTGFGEHFAEIYDKYGEFNLVLLDNAQYDARWAMVHMTPEEAIEASNILHANNVMPIHWGTFALANHPWDDPVERFTISGEENGKTVITPRLGETVNYKTKENYNNRWWRDID